MVGGRHLDRIFQAVQADADAQGRVDWSMVSVDSTSRRAHQHAAGGPAENAAGSEEKIDASAAPPRRRGRPGAA